MSTLYRLYRPKHFGEVIGQEHIRAALQNALTSSRISHAYLFSGPRGSGKTTLARLYAKAINCQKPLKDGNPCNACELCEQIISNAAVDIIEIDAASNRGIDEIRELRERVNFTPVSAKYKVYIIDEVHMLTKEAFNALLKTLEEPPSHVIFILATTELHKVPETILSRCQRFHFHLASPAQLDELLGKVAKAEKIELEKAALEILVERAEGSFRDGLSLLGSLVGRSGKISAAQLQSAFGLPTREVIEQLVKCLESGDAAALQRLLVSALEQGLDMVVLTKTLSDLFKRRILTGENSANLARDAQVMEQLLVALARSRHSSDPVGTIIARLVSVTAATAPAAAPLAEPALEAKAAASAQPAKDEPASVDPITRDKNPAAESTADISGPVQPIEGAEEFWSALLHEIKTHNHALYMLLRSAVLLELGSDKMTVAVKFRFYSERLFEAKNRKLIEKVAEKITGKKIALECVVKSDLDTRGNSDEDLVSAVVDVFELEEVD